MKKSQTKKFKTYRLYAAFPTQENVEKAAGSRFQRVTSRYILRYTDKHLEKPWMEVAGEDLKRLTDQDEAWLWDCGKVLAAETLAKRQEESGHRMADLLDWLEQELHRELENSRQETGRERGDASWET